MIEMIQGFGDMIQVIGHIDLPKLNVPVPDALLNLKAASTRWRINSGLCSK